MKIVYFITECIRAIIFRMKNLTESGSNIECLDLDLAMCNIKCHTWTYQDILWLHLRKCVLNLFLQQYIMDLEYGEGPYTVFVNVVDGGSSPTTATVTLSFTIPEATTLPPTTTNVPNPAYDALSSDDSLTVFLIIAAFISGNLYHY